MATPKKIWKWKHNKEPVDVVEETSGYIYYNVTVVKRYEKKYFAKEQA
jgi:hypothetical protein